MAIGKIGGMLAVLGVNTSAWMAGLSKAQKQWNTFGASMQVAGFRMAAVLTTAIVGLGATVVKLGATWERAFAGVKKTMEITTGDVEKKLNLVEQGLLSLAKTVPHSTTELAKFAQIGARMGVGSADILDFTQTISMLAVAIDDLDPEETAFGLAQLVKVTGASQKDFSKLGSVLAKLGDNFATTEQKILNFSQRASGLARVSGMSAQDIMGISAAFAQVRPQVESAATAVSKGLGQIVEAVASGGGKLEAFAAASGMAAADFSKAWKDDAAGTFVKVLDGIAASEEDAIALLKELGLNNERAKQTYLALAGSQGELARGLKMANDEFKNAKKLQMEFNTVMQTSVERAKVLWSQLQLLAIKGFKALDGLVIKTLASLQSFIVFLEGAVDWFVALEESIQNSIIGWLAFIAILGPLMIVLGGLVSLIVTISSVLSVPLVIAIGAVVIALRILKGQALDVFDAFKFVADIINTTTLIFNTLAAGLNSFQWLLATVGEGIVRLGVFMIMGFKKATPHLQKLIDYFVDLKETQSDQLDASHDRMTENMKAIVATGVQVDGLRKKWEEGGDTWEENQKKFKAATDKIKQQLADLETEGGLENLLAPPPKPDLSDIIDDGAKAAEDLAKWMNDAAKNVRDMHADMMEFQNSLRAAGITFVQDFMNLSESEGGILDGLLAFTPQAVSTAAAEFTKVVDLMKGDLGKLGQPLIDKVTPQFREFYKQLRELGLDAQADALGEAAYKAGVDIVDPEAFVGPMPAEQLTVATEKAWDFKKALDSVADAFRVLGISSSSVLGSILGGLAVGSESGARFMDAIGSMTTTNADGTTDFNMSAGGMMSAGTAAIGGAAAVMGATSSGSRGQRVAGGAAAGAAVGGQIMPGIGHAVGAIGGALVGALRDRRLLGLLGDIGRDWGVEISEELGKEIEAAMDDLDLGGFEATLLHFSEILGEAGGLSSDNLESFTDKFNDLLNAVANGSIPMAEGMEAINTGFADMVDGLQEMGSEGSQAIGELVNRMGELGQETESLKEHLAEQGAVLLEALNPALEWIASLTDLTTEEAEAFQGVVVAAFAGAVAATGSMIEAVGMLGETFKDALRTIQEALGPEGSKILGPLVGIYNFITNNEEVLGAISGIVAGLDAMQQMGILTAASLGSMSEGVRAAFQRLVGESGNLKMSIKSTWPELIKLYNTYRDMGLEVPDWLGKIIKEGEEMGLSMEMPATVLSSLQQMVDILNNIAKALGAVATEAGNIPSSPGGGNGSGSGSGGGGRNGGSRSEGMKEGGIIEPSIGGEMILVGEGHEREFVVPQSKLQSFGEEMGLGSGGGVSIGNITYVIEGGGDIEAIKDALEQNTENLTGTLVRELDIQAGINGGS